MIKDVYNAYQIILVGLGGTGGLLSTLLSRYIYDKSRQNNCSFTLSLVDGDRVEEKNIARQPFGKDDLNQFKSDSLCDAYSYLYGIDVSSVPKFIDTPEDIENIFNSIPYERQWRYEFKPHRIIIGAVDNHRARQVMNDYFIKNHCNDKSDLLYIDSANEFDFGTCICGYRMCDEIIYPPRAAFFPDILEDKGKSASELSCGEINISAPQHLVTNMTAANIIFSDFCNFVEEGTVSGGVTYFYPLSNTMVHRNIDVYGDCKTLTANYLDFSKQCSDKIKAGDTNV